MNTEIAVLDKFLDIPELETLVERLRKAPKTSVTLRGNCLGAEGAEVLGRYLKEESCEITSLSLEWNQLGSAGASVLANALAANTSVTQLDLRNNNIKDEGVIAITKALQVNQSLRSLDMRWNQITDGMPFKESLLSRRPPLRLEISGNHLSESSSIIIQNWIIGEDIDEISVDDSNIYSDPASGAENMTANTRNTIAGSSKNNMNFPRSQGILDANITRLTKENGVLRKQTNTVQEEVINLNKQLELSAVRVTELEQNILKEQFAKSQLEDSLKTYTSRVTVQIEERSRLVDSWNVERQSMKDDCQQLLTKRDEELSSICLERDRAVQDCRLAKEHSEKMEIQLNDQGRHGNQERASLEEELSVLRVQLSELTLSENKMKSQVSTLQTKYERSEANVNHLENEIIKERAQLEAVNKEMIEKYDKEDNQKNIDWNSKLSDANEKISSQSTELQDCYKKISKLEAESSSIRADIELENEKLIKSIRKDEAQRTEGIISDLKNKVDMFVNSRTELETRNKEYLTELTDTQERNKTSLHKITTQLNAAEAELERLRSLNATLRDENATLLAGSANNDNEVTELRKRMKMHEEVNNDIKTKLAMALAARADLEERTRDLQLSTAKHDAQRQVEFFTVKNSLMKVFQREFDGLQASFGLAPEQNQPISSQNSPPQQKAKSPGEQANLTLSQVSAAVVKEESVDEDDDNSDFSVEESVSSSSESSGEDI